MKNLLLAFCVAPLIWMSQLSGFQLVEADPAHIIVDSGLFLEVNGVVQEVENFFVNGEKEVWALLKDGADELKSGADLVKDGLDQVVKESGWIFYLPVNPHASQQRFNKEVEKYVGPLTRPMGTILIEEDEEECDCGCGGHEQEFVEVQGVLSTWLKDLYRRASNQSYPINSQGKSCNCKNKHKEKYFINELNGNLIVNVQIEIDDEDFANNEIIKVYVDDEEVAEVIIEVIESGTTPPSTESYTDVVSLTESEEEELLDEILFAEESDDSSTSATSYVIGYDRNGAYYYNQNILFKLPH